MATDPARIKKITDALEASYKALKGASTNISGLLSMGRATCDEVAAYNLGALAIYDAQRGMLATLRAAGSPNVPELPQYPTLFPWRGVEGADALNINCSGQAQSLAGVMKRALRGPNDKTIYLGLDQVEIAATGQGALDPGASPSWEAYATAMEAQKQAGLGLAPVVVLIIAGFALGVAYVALEHLSAYMTEKKIQEEMTEDTRIQAEAFRVYTAARLACYEKNLAAGNTPEQATELCVKLVTKPDIKIGARRAVSEWGMLEWIGAVVVIGGIAVVGFKIYEKKKRGESLLPSWAHLPG
jgi:hypothetical protein